MGRARLIPGTTTIVYSVYPSVKEVGFAPAAHYFIYMPERFAFWESHPFTAASWRSGSNRRNHQAPDKVITALQDIKYLESGYKSSSTSSDGKRKTTTITMTTKELGRKPTAPKKAKLTFLIQARSGMTHKLCQRILDSRDGYVDIPCLLEGPYGKLRPVSAFPTVVVIAGGVGISTALPYLRKHLYRGRDPTRRFALIWTLRDAEVADNILQEVKGLSFRPDVSVKVYITGGEDRNREGSGKDKELGLGMGGGGCWRMPLGVDVKYRRPRIAEAIVRESEARVPGTPMAVIACGSGSVVDAARQGAVKALEGAAGSKGMGEVMYWEEGHGW